MPNVPLRNLTVPRRFCVREDGVWYSLSDRMFKRLCMNTVNTGYACHPSIVRARIVKEPDRRYAFTLELDEITVEESSRWIEKMRYVEATPAEITFTIHGKNKRAKPRGWQGIDALTATTSTHERAIKAKLATERLRSMPAPVLGWKTPEKAKA